MHRNTHNIICTLNQINAACLLMFCYLTPIAEVYFSSLQIVTVNYECPLLF